jgi:hypothetical protein
MKEIIGIGRRVCYLPVVPALKNLGLIVFSRVHLYRALK